MEVLPDNVRVWVKEWKPRTSEEAGKLAEDYRQALKAELWTSIPTKSGTEGLLPLWTSRTLGLGLSHKASKTTCNLNLNK